MGCDSGDGPGAKWIIGFIACCVGSFFNALGFVVQKKAHTDNASHETQDVVDEAADPRTSRKSRECCGLVCSPLWVCGLLSVGLSLPIDIVSIMFMPQTVHSTLSGVTLVMGQVVAPWILNERVTCLDWMATFVIVLGVGMSMIFGSHCSKEFTMDEIHGFFWSTPFQLVESTAPIFLCCGFFTLRVIIPKIADEAVRSKYTSMIYSVLAGIIGGQQFIFFKAATEGVEGTFHGDASGWADIWTWIFAGMAVVAAFFHIMLINLGIKHWSFVKTFPVYMTSLVFFSAFHGGAFYQEYKDMSTTGFIFFPIAVCVVMAGILMLMHRDTAAQVVPFDGDAILPQTGPKTIPTSVGGPSTGSITSGVPTEPRKVIILPSEFQTDLKADVEIGVAGHMENCDVDADVGDAIKSAPAVLAYPAVKTES